MKLAFLSPTYPPDRCGVGDHGAKLVAALRAQGTQVIIARSLKDPALQEDFDALVVQYTPYLWPTLGYAFNLQFPLQLWRLKKKKQVPFFVIVHELYYPLFTDLKGTILGLLQRLEFFAVKAVCNWSFFTYRKPQTIYPKKSSVLPVGSNIHAGFRKEQNQGPLRLVHFGGSHPTHLLQWTLSSFEKLVQTHPDLDLHLDWIGISEEKKNSVVGLHPLRDRIHGLGYLSEVEVSWHLSQATMALAPFWDGISTRRGSAMAALQHGLPMATTLGPSSDPDIPWESFALTSQAPRNPEDADKRDEFEKLVSEALTQPDLLQKLGKKSRDFYQNAFSWDCIARDLSQQVKKEIQS